MWLERRTLNSQCKIKMETYSPASKNNYIIKFLKVQISYPFLYVIYYIIIYLGYSIPCFAVYHYITYYILYYIMRLCRYLILATGVDLPNKLDIQGSEYITDYSEASVNIDDYTDKTVLIIGYSSWMSIFFW